MHTHVYSASPMYFRCHRLAATLTPQQCRLNRERCETLPQDVELTTSTAWGVPTPCFQCPQAARVDAGQGRWFTRAQVLAGEALREPAAEILPGQQRFSAEPRDPTVFTSNFWVPECDL